MKIWGLRAKLIPLIIAMDILVVGALTIIFYTEERDSVTAALDGRLQAVAVGAFRVIPDTYYSAAQRHDAIAETAFLTFRDTLTAFATETAITAIYVYIQDGPRILTIAASATTAQLAHGPAETLLQHYATAPRELYESFADGQPHYLDYRDGYGHFRGVFLPRKTVSGATYVIDVDMSQSFLDEKLHTVLLKALLACVIGIGSSLVIMLPLISFLLRPMSQLSDITAAIVQRDFQTEAEERALLTRLGRRGDEVGLVSRAIDNMLVSLRRYLADFTVVTTERERLNGELNAARETQLGMLPRTMPKLADPGLLDLHAMLEPAKAVGGDLFDYFLLDADRLFFMVGDVSGKGMSAALFMAITRTKFRTHASAGFSSLAEVMRRVNRELSEENPADMFVTVFTGVLDLRTGSVEYCDGGHDAPLILRRSDGRCEWLQKKRGLLLGLYEQHAYQIDHFQLNAGDGLVLFTDGVTEAMTSSGDMFTAARLSECFNETGSLTAADMVNRLYSRIKDFAADAEQSDDIAILALRYKPRSPVETQDIHESLLTTVTVLRPSIR